VGEDAASDPIERLGRLFDGPPARRPFGEPVAIGVHMRQCAALAQRDDAPPPLVAAALLHDIAYVLSPCAQADGAFEADHARIGAAWVLRWFPPSVSEPVRLHVEAKRYLTSVEPSYGSALSGESDRTLGLQGGPMSHAESRRFHAQAHSASSVRLRRYDDLAKDPDFEPPGIENFFELLRSVLVKENPSAGVHGDVPHQSPSALRHSVDGVLRRGRGRPRLGRS